MLLDHADAIANTDDRPLPKRKWPGTRRKARPRDRILENGIGRVDMDVLQEAGENREAITAETLGIGKVVFFPETHLNVLGDTVSDAKAGTAPIALSAGTGTIDPWWTADLPLLKPDHVCRAEDCDALRPWNCSYCRAHAIRYRTSTVFKVVASKAKMIAACQAATRREEGGREP